MKKFGRLNKDTYHFLKGTEFEITNEDDGFWSNNPFYSGLLDGRQYSFDMEYVDIISNDEFLNVVIKAPEIIYEKEQWWEYVNYP